MDAEPPSQATAPGNPGGYPPADLARRLLARACDALALALVIALLGPLRRSLVATLSAVALILCGDRLFGPGRSLGKKLAGLRVVVLRTRLAGGITASMRRNALFAVAVLPAAGGTRESLLWALVALVAAAALECGVLLAPLTRDLGRRRLGDLLAGTQVIDASIPLGLAAPKLPSRAPAAAISAAPRHAARAKAAPH